MTLKWNVIYHDPNKKQIQTYNVFDHSSFYKDVIFYSKKCKTREEFSKEIKLSAKYYFWSKCEWEVVVKPFVGKETEDMKIDVFWQLNNNWNIFIDYIWKTTRILWNLKIDFI